MTMMARTLPGLIGRKLGMTQVFREDGAVIPVTAVEVGPCTVVQVKTREKEGYSAVQMGFGEQKRLTSPEKGHLKGLGNFGHLREFLVGEGAGIEVGQKFDVGLFKPGDIVDVTGTSKGKGFAGVVKRWHFHGGDMTHGSMVHRKPQSGGATDAARTFKGVKRPGRMGGKNVTQRGLTIYRVDPERNVILVKGAVPGATGALLLVARQVVGG